MNAKNNTTITAVDLFCGAGGTSTGLIQAAESIWKKVELTAINHWSKAIETHKANHAEVRHLCENLDNVNPRALFPQGRINLLVASPECTHHSNDRGGVPCCSHMSWPALNHSRMITNSAGTRRRSLSKSEMPCLGKLPRHCAWSLFHELF